MQKELCLLVFMLFATTYSASACDDAISQNKLTLSGYTIQSSVANSDGTSDLVMTNGIDKFICSSISQKCHKQTNLPNDSGLSASNIFKRFSGGYSDNRPSGGCAFSMSQLGSKGFNIIKEIKDPNTGQTDPVWRKGSVSYRCTAKSEFKCCYKQ